MRSLSDERYWKFHFDCLKASNFRSVKLMGVHLSLHFPHLDVRGLTLFRLGGEGGFWCPRQLWLACNFRQFKIILPYHRTFPQIYLAIWWYSRILIMRSGGAMVTAFWRACLAEIWISYLFFTLNWIVMLGIEYFGNLEHYCFSWSVTSPMTS